MYFPLWISEHRPRLVASLADIDGLCPKSNEAFDLGLRFAGLESSTGLRSEMHSVLDDLVVGARQQADVEGCVVGSADDDLPLAFGEWARRENTNAPGIRRTPSVG
jgi:hypothetical protein